MYEFQCKNHGLPMPEDEAHVEIDGGQDQLSESTTRQPRRPKIQIRKKKVDPGKLSFITSSNTDEGADIGIVFVGLGTITKTWDNTTRNKFTRYAFMVGT